MAGEWFCKIAGRERGPLSPVQLKSLATDGELRPQDLVRQGIEGQWVPADRVKGLFLASAPKPTMSVAKPPDADRPAASVPRAGPPPIPSAFRSPPKGDPQDTHSADPTRPSIQLSPAVQALAKQTTKRRRMRGVQIASMVMLGLVAIALGVVGYVLWRQGAPVEEPATTPPVLPKSAAVAKKPEPGEAKKPVAVAPKPKREPEVKWYNAASDTVNFSAEQVAVKVRSANVTTLAARFAVRDATKKYLVLSVNLHNKGTTKKLDFESWGKLSASSVAVTLNDEHNNRYKLIRVQGEQAPSVYPGKDYTDEVIFEPPVDSAKTLRLVLPAAAFGGKGEIRFEIPRTMITSAPESTKPAATEPSATVPAIPPAERPAKQPAAAAKPADEQMPGMDGPQASAPAAGTPKPNEIDTPLPIDLNQPIEVRPKKGAAAESPKTAPEKRPKAKRGKK